MKLLKARLKKVRLKRINLFILPMQRHMSSSLRWLRFSPTEKTCPV
jgi:hypothetical protein